MFMYYTSISYITRIYIAATSTDDDNYDSSQTRLVDGTKCNEHGHATN